MSPATQPALPATMRSCHASVSPRGAQHSPLLAAQLAPSSPYTNSPPALPAASANTAYTSSIAATDAAAAALGGLPARWTAKPTAPALAAAMNAPSNPSASA